MTPEIQAFAAGFPTTLAHAGVSLLLLIVGAAVYAVLSPHREIGRIRDGNGAAAVLFAGVLLGLAAPLAVSLTASASLAELAIWGAAITALQLLLFRIADLLLRGLPERVREGDITAAVLLASARLASALLVAAAVAA
jgi:putative membrane protein